MNSTTVQQETSPLVKNPKLVFVACLFLAVSMAAYGLSLSTIQGPVLIGMDGMDLFTFITAICSAALCIATPIGGSLMDKIGTRRVVAGFGGLVIVCGLILAFTNNIWLYLILRTLLSLGQGGFASVPFIVVRKIFPANQVPKYIGYITTGFGVGSFLGSWLAGIFLDMNMVWLATAFPLVFLVPGVVLMWKEVAPQPVTSKVSLDWVGIILLGISLLSLVFSLNFGAMLGWTSWQILCGFAVCIASTVILLLWENKQTAPLIPLRLFNIPTYSLLLIITSLAVVYMTAVNVYIPMAVQQVMGQSGSVTGTLQIPRTIASLLVPPLAGVWVAKTPRNFWKSQMIAMLCIALPMSALVFIGVHMPIWFIYLCLAFTGAADSFRSVSTIPAAQQLIPMKDIGVGTSLIGFVISFAGVLGSSLFSIAYNTLTQANPGAHGITMGVDTVFLICAGCAWLGLILVIFLFRPMFAQAIARKNQKD